MKKFLAQQQRLENDSGPVHVCVCVSLLVSACVHDSVRECAGVRVQKRASKRSEVSWNGGRPIKI